MFLKMMKEGKNSICRLSLPPIYRKRQTNKMTKGKQAYAHCSPGLKQPGLTMTHSLPYPEAEGQRKEERNAMTKL